MRFDLDFQKKSQTNVQGKRKCHLSLECSFMFCYETVWSLELN